MSIKAKFMSARAKASKVLIDHIIQHCTLEDRNALFRVMRAEDLKSNSAAVFPDSFWKLLIRSPVLDEQPDDTPRIAAVMIRMPSQFQEIISMELIRQTHKKGKQT